MGHDLRWALVVLGTVWLTACTPREAEPTVTTLPVPQATTTTEAPTVLGPGIDEGLIRLGALLPLSGALGPLGSDVAEGHGAYWAYVNQELGGIEGFLVDVETRDSRYDPALAVSEVDDLDSIVLAISTVLGSPMTEALLPTSTAEDLLMAAGAQVSSWGPERSVLLDLALAAYRDQVLVGLEWAATGGEVEEGAVAGLIAQEGIYGDDCADGFRRGVADARLTLGPELRPSLTQTEFSAELAAVGDAGVELLVVCSLPDETLAMLGAAVLLEVDPLMVTTTASYAPFIPGALGGDAGEEAGLAALDGLFVVGALEEPRQQPPGLVLYEDNLNRLGLDPDEASWYTFVGYTQAATMHAVLLKAFELRDVSRAGLMEAAGSLGPVDFGFGAGPVSFEDGVPTPVDALGRPTVPAARLFGLERVSDFIRLEG